jgi:ABC-2 type transport system permease protein
MFRLKLLMKLAQKDWREIRSNKQIMVPMIVVPVVFSIFYPILMVVLPLSGGEASLAEFGGIYGFLAMMVDSVIKPLFVLIPLLITMAIASDSWAGEKERKTAESIFLLPLTDTELFTAKVLASFIPGMLITWACSAATMTIVDVATSPFLSGMLYLPNSSWLYMLFVFTPVMSFFTIYINVWVSYRARDTKSAQQIGGSVIVVVLGVMVSSFLGLMDLVLFILTACFGAIDIILIKISPRVFSREVMISKF